MKKLIAVLAAIPLAAFAQGAPPKGAPGPGAGPGWGPGRANPEWVQKRARLALTLGLAVALDLDDAQALKLGDVVAKFGDRRRAALEQVRDARLTLRKAAQGEKVGGREVDQAIAKVLDGRAQIQAIDRELVGAVTKDLTPEKKARAMIFLERFHHRFGGPGMGPGMMRGQGPGGPGMRGGPRMGGGMGGGMGMRGGMGMGPGSAMAGACPGPDCDWDAD